MKLSQTVFELILICGIIVAIFAESRAYAQSPMVVDCLGERAKYDFPIVLRGALKLYGAMLGRVSAHKVIGGRWEQIPIQIDEVNPSGDYVLENGLPFTAGTGDGVYNGKDELSFDGRNLGDDFELSTVPKDLKDITGRVWKLRLCNSNEYVGSLLIRSGIEVESGTNNEPAVKFQESPPQITSDLYRYNFNDLNPVLLGQVWLRSEPKGESGNNSITEHQVIESSSFVMPLRLPWWAPDFSLTDQNFKSSVECWRSGPVRTIVAVGVKFRNFLSMFNLHMFSELVFYRNKFQVPTVIQFTFNPSTYLKPGSGLFYAITFPEGKGWDVQTNLADLPESAAVDIVKTGKSALEQDVYFANGSRPEGAFAVNVRVDPEARKLVPPPFFVKKAMFSQPEYKKVWPEIMARGGDMGVYLDISGVRTGVYDFGLDLLLSREASQRLRDSGSVEAHWEQFDKTAGPPAK